MGYFYNKEIILLKQSDGYRDNNGIWHKGGISEHKTILCDVQPASRDLIYKEYSYYIDCKKRVFCDIDTDIKTGSYFRYNGELFVIAALVEWDDYYDLFADYARDLK